MSGCVALTPEMLIAPRRLKICGEDLDFAAAKAIADREARSINPDTMLLAWFDRRRGTFSPRVE